MNKWTETVGAIGVFALLISVLTISIWQFALSYRAKAAVSREQEYRRLAERTAAAEQRGAESLAAMAEDLGAVRAYLDNVQSLVALTSQLDDVQSRMRNVESILQTVE